MQVGVEVSVSYEFEAMNNFKNGNGFIFEGGIWRFRNLLGLLGDGLSLVIIGSGTKTLFCN